jgi:hypothetical protein
VTGVDLGFELADLIVDKAYTTRSSSSTRLDPPRHHFPDGTTIAAGAGETASPVVAVPAEGLPAHPRHADAGMKARSL